MNNRIYEVQNGENAIDINDVSKIQNVLTKFIIKPEHHQNNKHWNGIHQGDLEGYVLVKENQELMAIKIYGFGEDSKIVMEHKFNLNEDTQLRDVLLNYCDGYNPHTNQKLNNFEVKQVLEIIK